jgi:hypothetical protein
MTSPDLDTLNHLWLMHEAAAGAEDKCSTCPLAVHAPVTLGQEWTESSFQLSEVELSEIVSNAIAMAESGEPFPDPERMFAA